MRVLCMSVYAEEKSEMVDTNTSQSASGALKDDGV